MRVIAGALASGLLLTASSGFAGDPPLILAWSATGEQEGSLHSRSVAAAGDVNGDGYDDVVVAAMRHDNGHTDGGRIYVYHGSVTGLGSIPAWSADGSDGQLRVLRGVGR